METRAESNVVPSRADFSPPQLTGEQELAILRAASELVAAAVGGRAARLDDPTLAGAAQQMLIGSFLTIKRRGRLRACCGFLGRTATLTEALAEAASTSATRDPRLPRISPTELKYLDFDVCLLHTAEAITARGESRTAEVNIGRHGLQITRGASQGLLLPKVAVENRFSASRFLQQVCLKAGLPPTAWKEDDTQLLRFESHTIGGPFDASVLDGEAGAIPALFSETEVEGLARFCRENVIALVQGGTPNFYLTECSDGNVSGATLTWKLAEDEEPGQLSSLSLRPGLPLQATLFNLAEGTAARLKRQAVTGDRLATLQMNLTILYDAAMHGTLAEPDLDGIDPRRRAVLVMEHGKSGWVFNPERSPQELLTAAARQAHAAMPEAAAIYSLAARSTVAPVASGRVPRPSEGPAIRPAAVAGAFYPAESQSLSDLVEELLSGEAVPRAAWRAALVPHAGLKYSGRIAAEVFRRIEIPETVIVLGPKHTALGVEWAVAPHETWSIPGATVSSDPRLARELAAEIDGLELDAAAHQKEHAIEVELPLLSRLAPGARVVGIAIGAGNLDRCRGFAAGLAAVLRRRGAPTLLVVSSDMNHFASDVENRRLDEMALAVMERMDPAEVFRMVRGNHISMCGLLPAVIVLETLRQLGALEKCQRVGYATSAEVNGDTSRVVGYAGMLFG